MSSSNGRSNGALAYTVRLEFGQEGLDIPAGLANLMASHEIDNRPHAISLGGGSPPTPTGPDPHAPAMHQAWEEALDAEQAAQRLQAALQPYAAGLFDPDEITPADRQRIELYLVSIRASLIALERRLARAVVTLPVIGPGPNKSSGQ